MSLEDFKKLEKAQGIIHKPIFIAYPIDPWRGLDWGYISISRVSDLKRQQEHFIEKGHNWIGIKYDDLKRYNEIILLLI